MNHDIIIVLGIHTSPLHSDQYKYEHPQLHPCLSISLHNATHTDSEEHAPERYASHYIASHRQLSGHING